MRKILFLAAALAPAAALAAPPAGVRVATPWARYLLPNIPAGIYLTLSNSSDAPATLVGASSPACGTLMLHESMVMGGSTMMMEVASALVPAHGSLAMAEGGYHLMCMNPKMTVGGKVPVVLDFADGSTLAVTAPVYGADSAP